MDSPSDTRGIGVDLVSVERIKKALVNTAGFAERILTPAELTRMRQKKDGSGFVAKRFAGKEAVVKALGTGVGAGIGWQQIEIINDATGAPVVTLTGMAKARMDALGATRCMLSLSDEREFAMAFAILC